LKASDIPTKFNIPFAANATGSFVRDVPETTADRVAASDTLGFPPDTFTPVGAGGTPPDGRDLNGILRQTTAWDQWGSAGGPIMYDAAFQAALLPAPGYPKGAIVASAVTFGQYWLSTVDDNVTNPDEAGAGWTGFQLPPVTQTGSTPTAGHFALWTAPYAIQDGGAPGTAAFKAASNNGLGSVASIASAVVGHFATFSDGNGSIQDGGVVGDMSHQTSSNVAITGGNATGLSSCSIVTAAANAGFTVTCPNPLLTLQNGSGGNSWVIQQNSATAQMTLSFNASGVGVFDHISGSYTATSDERLKQDVSDLPPVLDKIARLRPVTFSYKSDEDKKTHIGLLAQELRVEFPEFVNAVGRDDLPDEGYLGIDYATLSAVALRAIQELRAEVAQLRKDAGLS
jgi:hypothetical protein